MEVLAVGILGLFGYHVSQNKRTKYTAPLQDQPFTDGADIAPYDTIVGANIAGQKRERRLADIASRTPKDPKFKGLLSTNDQPAFYNPFKKPQVQNESRVAKVDNKRMIEFLSTGKETQKRTDVYGYGSVDRKEPYNYSKNEALKALASDQARQVIKRNDGKATKMRFEEPIRTTHLPRHEFTWMKNAKFQEYMPRLQSNGASGGGPAIPPTLALKDHTTSTPIKRLYNVVPGAQPVHSSTRFKSSRFDLNNLPKPVHANSQQYSPIQRNYELRDLTTRLEKQKQMQWQHKYNPIPLGEPLRKTAKERMGIKIQPQIKQSKVIGQLPMPVRMEIRDQLEVKTKPMGGSANTNRYKLQPPAALRETNQYQGYRLHTPKVNTHQRIQSKFTSKDRIGSY